MANKNNRFIEYFDSEDENCIQDFSNTLGNLIRLKKTENQELIVLCIGTDRATGDCLGPIVGSALKGMDTSIHVYGTLSSPVHAVNLNDIIAEIETNFINPFVIVVDASLGSTSHIGYITLSDGSIKPGKGVNKELPAIGDISITGIVNLSGFPGTVLLSSTRLFTVMKLSQLISHGIANSFTNYYSFPYTQP